MNISSLHAIFSCCQAGNISWGRSCCLSLLYCISYGMNKLRSTTLRGCARTQFGFQLCPGNAEPSWAEQYQQTSSFCCSATSSAANKANSLFSSNQAVHSPRQPTYSRWQLEVSSKSGYILQITALSVKTVFAWALLQRGTRTRKMIKYLHMENISCINFAWRDCCYSSICLSVTTAFTFASTLSCSGCSCDYFCKHNCKQSISIHFAAC